MTQTSIRSGELTLRPWSEDDLDAIVRRINDPDVGAFLDRLPQPYTETDAREWFAICAAGWAEGRLAAFGLHVDDLDGAVGGIGVNFLDGLDEGGAEVGYWVAAEARGRGIATAATRAVAEWVFAEAPDLVRLQLRADTENISSNRVAEKAGFTREGILRAQRFNVRLGRRADFVMWSLLREEL